MRMNIASSRLVIKEVLDAMALAVNKVYLLILLEHQRAMQTQACKNKGLAPREARRHFILSVRHLCCILHMFPCKF